MSRRPQTSKRQGRSTQPASSKSRSSRSSGAARSAGSGRTPAGARSSARSGERPSGRGNSKVTGRSRGAPGSRQERPAAQERQASRPEDVGSSKSTSRRNRARTRDSGRSDAFRASKDCMWIYGVHAVTAALDFRAHEVKRVLVMQEALIDFEQRYGYTQVPIERVGKAEISEAVGNSARHQGVAAEISRPEELFLEDVLPAEDKPSVVVILDGVEDPGNLGAIVRSAYAHGAHCVISPTRNAAPLTALTYKAACGAMSSLPVIQVANLSQTLKKLKSKGYWIYGFDADAQGTAEDTQLHHRAVLIIGGENRALRRLTKEGCDAIVSIPMQVSNFSMNAAQSASIALYEWSRQMRSRPQD